jgi:hypothetical protein
MSFIEAKRNAQPRDRRRPFRIRGFQQDVMRARSFTLKITMKGRRISEARKTLKKAIVNASRLIIFTITPFNPQRTAADDIESIPRGRVLFLIPSVKRIIWEKLKYSCSGAG